MDGLVLSTTTFNVPGGQHYLIRLDGGTTYLSLRMLRLPPSGITITAGSVYGVFGASTRNCVIGRVSGLSSITGLSNVDATDTTVSVVEWTLPKASADNGDANKTLAMGDPLIQFFSTELTANRTVSLPRRFNPTSAYNGARFRIVRNAATPGAFTLTINGVDQGTIATIASGTRACVDLVYRRNAWVVDCFTTLP
jgi:hypothetical protein